MDNQRAEIAVEMDNRDERQDEAVEELPNNNNNQPMDDDCTIVYSNINGIEEWSNQDITITQHPVQSEDDDCIIVHCNIQGEIQKM